MIRDERGIALVELLVVVAIVGLITGTLTTAIYQIYHVTGWGNNELVVQHDLQNAATWLNRDVICAYRARVINETQMVLDIRQDWSGVITRIITYTLSGQELVREVSTGSSLPVARHIVSSPFPPAGTLTSAITITLTSQVGDVAQSATLHLDMRPTE
jgi:type II secretory pathway pseudopilin PulG